MLVAQQFANANQAAGRAVQLNASNVQFGTWNATANPPRSRPARGGQAVKVTTRTDANDGGAARCFFGRLFGLTSTNQQASAVAAVNPRDIVTRDRHPARSTTTPARAVPSCSSSLMQTVYNQFGFGTYPNGTGGTATLKSTTLNSTTLKQLQLVMPNVIPVPSLSNSAYWGKYLVYAQQKWKSVLGYQSYLDFMMNYGRDVKPDGTDYTPLSLNSNLCACPLHSETVGGAAFSSRRMRCPPMPPAPR